MRHVKFLGRVLLLAAVLGGIASSAVRAGTKVGDSFPDLRAYKLEGQLPGDLKDKVVVVDFWASWCGPCKESFPIMNELHRKYRDQGVVILAVNVDESRADMDAFLKQHAAEFPVIRDAAQKLVEKVEVGTMPSSFILDRAGKVRFMHTGFKGEETRKKYLEEISSLLKP